MSGNSSDSDFGHLTRRGALRCLGAWSGAAIVWGVAGGVPRALGMANEAKTAYAAKGQFTFAQISDTHLGFHKEANPDVLATLRRAITDINGLPQRPAFAVHTGDITHLSKPDEFDLASQVLKELNVSRIHYVPGEHDVLDNGLSGYLRRYDSLSNNRAYYSFDDHGVHFVGLTNVTDFKAGSMAALGDEQLAWLERDLASLSASTPIVVLAHIPLWTVYEPWGWGTADSGRALSYLRRFGSVTVLNGHIHQVMQKVEGNVSFHTAMSTAYPQPHPGQADQPGPLKVDAGQLGKLLGTRQIAVVRGKRELATIDAPIERI
jgi:3',5'-cyclic-AMP phosphodiesterase